MGYRITFMYNTHFYFYLYFSFLVQIIKFSFTNINPANPSQVYILNLNIQGKSYNVDGCLPMIDGMKELLDEVNESRDLYVFLKKVRLGFVALASSK